MSLKGKTAIVTGGSSGIGASIAIELAKQGADVVIDYHAHPQGAEAVAKEIASAGSKSLIVQADVGRVQDIQRLIDATVKQFGKIDILVNNAGVETRTSILDTTEDQFDKVMHVNLKSAFFSMQMAAKQMIQKKIKGRIINISSVHEEWPMPYNTAYCLSKGGLKMLTRTSALELAKYGILAVNVAPGAIATPINLSTMKDPALLQKLNAAIPLGRMGKPEEIASVVAFLAGDGGSYITSTTIFVDGGIMHQSSGL